MTCIGAVWQPACVASSSVVMLLHVALIKGDLGSFMLSSHARRV